jgi:hypothetical protein
MSAASKIVCVFKYIATAELTHQKYCALQMFLNLLYCNCSVIYGTEDDIKILIITIITI